MVMYVEEDPTLEAVKAFRTLVWIMEHEHKHGNTISIWSDGEDARAAAAKVVEGDRANWNVPDEVTNEEAVDQWFALTGGNEVFRFTRTRVLLKADVATYES